MGGGGENEFIVIQSEREIGCDKVIFHLPSLDLNMITIVSV